jgi:UDP-2-acetamido-3-amino-2,3-dideoxy-glucuronate N-acetyltransferase
MIHALSNVLSKNIGPTTEVWQFCVILPEAVVGDNCNICSHVFIENKVIIGNNVTIKNGVQIWDGITIEDNVFIGPNATFTNELVPRSKVYSSENLKCTLVKKGATIGANATILPGITIGEYAFIGAGSVVTKDIMPFTLMYGNPATQRGYITAEGIILDMDKKDVNGIEHALRLK